MYELSQIILWILWRLRPAMAVEANLVDILTTGFGLFQDEETLHLMADDPDYCATVTAALADAHTKLDLFVYLRACEIASLRSRARDFTPNRTAPRSGRTPQGCWSVFRRLVLRFEDRERLAQKRAEHLQRETSNSPLRLDASHQSTSPSLRLVEATHRCLASPSAQHWGRWIARPCAQDGGGLFAQPRGPPRTPDVQNQTTRLAATCENAPACALRAKHPGYALTVIIQHHDHAAAIRQFLDPVLGCDAAILDDFTKNLFGVAPGFKALPPSGGWHNERRFTFEVGRRKYPATQPINEMSPKPIFPR